MSTGQHYRIPSRDRKTSYLVPVPSSDIEKCISFNALGLVVSVISLVLSVSDVPRSGTGIFKLDGWLRQVQPDTAVFFGPFTFHSAKIVRFPVDSSSTASTDQQFEYQGFLDGESIYSTPLWSYKFDTMSVPQRALAKALNVSAYPPCILYKSKCRSNKISLSDTFLMLDGLISAIHSNYFPNSKVSQFALPVGFRTVSYWVDRFHHYFLTFFGHKHSEKRLHAVHFYRIAPNQTLNVCDQNIRKSFLPFFCDIPIKWTCTIPYGNDIQWSSSDGISLALHLMVRLAQMHRQYPQLHFDVTIFTSQMLSSNMDQRLPIATSLLQVQKNGVTTIIRGRSCQDPDSASCETVLIDDHRYEREFLTTDVTHWYWIVSLARGISQDYVWVRIWCLWYGCYRARSSELKHQHAPFIRRVWCACVTFFRIPSHVIIYSSWMPALGYAFAYFVDCTVNHQHIDEVFSAVNGTFIFDFWKFLRLSCVQMRNVWFIALFLKCLTMIEIKGLTSRWELRHGLRSFNGYFIGWISALTIFTPMRRLEFRTSDVVSVDIVPTNLILKLNSMPSASDLIVEFGFRLDLQSIVQSCILICLAVTMAKVSRWVYWFLLRLRGRSDPLVIVSGRSLVYTHSKYLPFCLGTITSCSSMSFYWDTTLINPHRKPSALRKLIGIINTMPWVLRSQRTVFAGANGNSSVAGPKVMDVDLKQNFKPGPFKAMIPAILSMRGDHNAAMNPLKRSYSRNELIYRVELRTKAIRSMVRLINLALFTDPLTLFKLYFVGCPLYIYRVISVQAGNKAKTEASQSASLFLLPCTLSQLLENTLTGDQCEEGNARYEFVDTVDSTDVQWDLLLHCG